MLHSRLLRAYRLRWGTHPSMKPNQRSDPGQKRFVRRDVLENMHVRDLIKDSQGYFREQEEVLLEDGRL